MKKRIFIVLQVLIVLFYSLLFVTSYAFDIQKMTIYHNEYNYSQYKCIKKEGDNIERNYTRIYAAENAKNRNDRWLEFWDSQPPNSSNRQLIEITNYDFYSPLIKKLCALYDQKSEINYGYEECSGRKNAQGSGITKRRVDNHGILRGISICFDNQCDCRDQQGRAIAITYESENRYYFSERNYQQIVDKPHPWVSGNDNTLFYQEEDGGVILEIEKKVDEDFSDGKRYSAVIYKYIDGEKYLIWSGYSRYLVSNLAEQREEVEANTIQQNVLEVESGEDIGQNKNIAQQELLEEPAVQTHNDNSRAEKNRDFEEAQAPGFSPLEKKELPDTPSIDILKLILFILLSIAVILGLFFVFKYLKNLQKRKQEDIKEKYYAEIERKFKETTDWSMKIK